MSGVPEANAVTGSAKNGISDSNEGNSSSGHSKDVSSFSSVSDTKVKEVVEYDQQKDLRTLAELICSGALDPQFKMRYIEFFCLEVKHKDGKRTKTKVAIVLLAMQERFDDFVIRFPTEEESCRPRRWKRSCRVVKDYQQFIRSNNHPAKKSDLDRYLEEPVLPWSPDFNALS